MDELSPTARRLIEDALAEDEPEAAAVERSWGEVLTGLDSVRQGGITVVVGPAGEELGHAARPRVEPVARPGERIGRYFVIDVLGKGAMGVVYRAFDPELERAVALKVVDPGFAARTDADEARARLVAEARALARLSHPNVVAIYDVGTHGEHLYLAMELVEGRDLAAWFRQDHPPWRAVVDAVVDVAEGLAAAHAQGLVHRDVKPGNVLVGHDGRVRVSDFGIARLTVVPETPTLAESEIGPTDADITQAGFVVGTPAYMAPEQHAGDEVGPAADQFALCVMLYEGLYGRRPYRGDAREIVIAKLDGEVSIPGDAAVPRWLGAVVRRGLRPSPSDRYPDLHALVMALRDDPARHRRLRLQGLAAIALVGVGAMGWWRAAAAPEACEGVGGAMAEVWNADEHEALRRAFEATGRSYAASTAEAVAARLDARAQRWVTMRREACQATRIHREQSEALLDRRMACLDRRLDETRALVEVLQHADHEVVDRAQEAAGKLRGLERCADAAALQAEVAPPESERARDEVAGIRSVLATARAHRDAGRFVDGLAMAEAARARADALGYAPVQAEARIVQARLVDELGRSKEAVELAKQALWEAQAVGHDAAAAEAAVDLVWLAGERLGEPEVGLDWARYAEATLERAGGDDDLRGQLWLYEGAARSNAGDFDGGQAAYDRALAHLRDRFGDDHPAIPLVMFNVGNLLIQRGHLDGALAQFREALARLEAIYGPEHPRCAMAHDNQGLILRALGRMDEAEAEHRLAIDLLSSSLGPTHPEVALARINLAHVYQQMRRLQEAERLYLQAREELEAGHPDHPQLPAVLNNLGMLYADHGRPDEALDLLEEALRRLEGRLGPRHPELIHPLSGLARVHTELGQTEQALAILQRQHALVVAAHGDGHRLAAVALADMGYALMADGRMREARERFEAALAAFEANPDVTPTDLTIALNDLSGVLLALDRRDEAMPVLERAATLAEDESVVISARIDAHFNLATALADGGGDSARARAQGQTALRLLKTLGDDATEPREQVEAWLAALPD